MNRISPGLSLSKARVGFEQYKAAEGLSPNTLINYSYHLKLWQEYIGDIHINQITTQDLRADYKPRRLCGGDDPLSPKTIRNFRVTLSAFFRWACDEFDIPNPMKGVPAPRFEEAPVEPLSKEQVEALLKAAEYCREADTTDRRKFTMRRATARRDRALIMILLDTGLRASELCSLKIGDIVQKTGRVEVKHGVGGGAKFKKGRVVFLGKATRRVVWRYLAEREDGEDLEAPLFLGKFNRPMNKDVLRQLIASLGKKAGVKKCHPHRSDTRSPSPICALEETCSHCRPCSAIAAWIWLDVTHESRRSIFNRLTGAPARQTTGDCKPDIISPVYPASLSARITRAVERSASDSLRRKAAISSLADRSTSERWLN